MYTQPRPRLLAFALATLLAGCGPGADPQKDQLARELAAANFAKDNRAQALEALKPLVERSDALPSDLIDAACVHLRLGDAASAAGLLQRAAKASQSDPRYFYNRGRIAQFNAELESAARDFRRVLDLAPDDLPTRFKLIDSVQGSDPAEYERLLREVVARGIENAGSWYLPAIYKLGLHCTMTEREAEGEKLLDLHQSLGNRGVPSPRTDDFDMGNVGRIAFPAPRGSQFTGTGALPSFAAATAILPEFAGTSAVQACDLDNDGDLDLLAANMPPGQARTRHVPTTLFRNELVESGKPSFTDLTRAAGLMRAGNENDVKIGGIGDTAGGVGCADYDRDGDLDLFWKNTDADIDNALFRNEGGWRFTDVTAAAGVALQGKLKDSNAQGSPNWIDFDQDGWIDLLVTNERDSKVLLRNRGDGGFEDITRARRPPNALPFINPGYAQGACIADFDHDGDMDVFLPMADQAGRMIKNRLREQGALVFEDVTAKSGAGLIRGTRGCVAADFDNDGHVDLYLNNGGPSNILINDVIADFPPFVQFYIAWEPALNTLLRNRGDGTFEDVSAQAGIQKRNPATDVPMAKTMGIAPIDVDRDGWIDLFVANDTVQNFLFHNQRDGTFAEIGDVAGVGFDPAGNARGAMGIDVARFRNDQTLGVAIGNFANEMTSLYCATDEPLQFVDAAIATGLGPATRLDLTFGLFFFDYDLDGRLDILAANGHLEDDINKVQVSQHYEQPPQLFWNAGPSQATEFLKVPADNCGEAFARRMVGRGTAFADIDRDGDLDVLITAVGQKPRLLRNDQKLGHHWLRVSLQGKLHNRDAIGAWVELVLPDGTQLPRQVMPTRSYLSQCELPVTFGLGSHERIDRLVIRWPDGSEQEVRDLPVDQAIAIKQNPTPSETTP